MDASIAGGIWMTADILVACVGLSTHSKTAIIAFQFFLAAAPDINCYRFPGSTPISAIMVK